MAAPGRKTQLQVIHEISGQGGFGQIAGTFGTVPAGSLLGFLHCVVSQAFNSTTNVLSIGTTPGGAQIATGLDMHALGRFDVAAAFAAAGPFAVDTPIYYSVVATGPAATQGVATIWLDYLPGPG